jgi:import inner membrane translocase subunit TIM44
LKKSGVKVSDAVSEAVRSLEASGFYQGVSRSFHITIILAHNLSLQITRATAAVSSAVASSTEPIRNTDAYKAISEAVSDALDDSGASRYGGYEEKEVRRKLREKRLAKAGRQGGIARTQRVTEDPEYVYLLYFKR